MAVVHVAYEAEMQKFEAALRAQTDLTEKEIKKQIRAHSRLKKAAIRDAQETAREQARQAGKSTRAVKEKVGGLRKIFEGVQGSIGSTGSRITALGEAAAILGPAGIAGIAVGAFALALGGVAYGAGKAVAGMMEMVDNAADLVDELTGLNELMNGELFTAQTAANIRDAALAIDAMEASGSLLKITFADFLSPATEDLADDMTALKLAAADLAKEMDASAGERFSVGIKAAAAGLIGATGLNGAFVQAIGLAGAYQDEADGVKAALKEQADQEEAARVVAKALAQVERDKAKATRDAAQAAREHARDLRDEARAAKEAENELLLLAEVQAQNAAFDNEVEEERSKAQLAAADAELKQYLENRAEMAAADEHAAKVREEQERAWADIQRDVAYQAVAIAAGAAEQLGLDSFRAAQLTAVAQIAIDSIRAAMSWSAQVPPPAVPAAIAAAAALGAVQAGLVMAQSPPSFHVGGLLGQSTPLAPDETYRTLRGEPTVGVLSRQGFEAANRGQSSGGEIVIVQQLRHKALDAQYAESVQMPGSSIRRSLKSTRRGRVGHRRR